ncbi:ribosomal protein S6 kinase 2 beta isoform X2 [Parasteatoda tepidariorum]|uniref:ribosomal protein S6 kinase 2 beta isoform X2 n=1 Tax=Parasteatoda tepidariorum TaxID=114398 RepID=UPI001C728309|nr:ribosomal protein S6 kinase 2 beta isoform X1 [Parasteatoda tepidariorum]
MPLAYLGVPFNLNGCETNGTQKQPEAMVLDEEYNQETTKDAVANGAVSEIELKNVTKEGYPKAVPRHFHIIKVLGQGSFGKVYLVKKVAGPDTNTLYAMKVLKKASLKVRDRVRSKFERDILVDVHHPFIVKLHYAFQTEGKLYLILDYLKCGDLFSRLSKDVMFTEDDSKFYLAELVLALEHLHSLGIIYRDLKPENILLGEDGHICLTDFGLCKESLNNEKAFSFCGTVEYMAPEVVSRKGHTTAADWWSFGVLMFEMLTGSLPFHSSNKKQTMDQILKARLQMPYYLSEPAQSLLRCLFKRNPDNRLSTGPEMRKHCFFAAIDFVKLYAKEVKPPFIPAAPPNICERTTQEVNADSPGVPASATAHELFRGFSYIESNLFDGHEVSNIYNRVELQLCKTSFSKEYKTLEPIGMGGFSICKKCIHISTGKLYAVKEINKNAVQKSNLSDCTEEIEILFRYGKHPNIVTLYEVFEDEKTIYLVMELLNGGELLDKLDNQNFYSEREASAIFEIIAKTVLYLHDNMVVHRDLNPSNIMYANSDPQSLRIIDFGFAKQMKAENGLLMTPCYTLNFAAPEVLKRKGYGEACDVWSMGVMLSIMLTGCTPFVKGPNEDMNTILPRIEQGQISMSTGNWKNISFIAKELIRRMLITDPKSRFTLSDVLNHDFIRARHLLPETRITLGDIAAVKDGAKITYEAKNIEQNKMIKLLPVTESELAQRRRMKQSVV